MCILFILAWLLIGVASVFFIDYVVKQDVTLKEVVIGGILGAITFLAGLIVLLLHCLEKVDWNKVVYKRKKYLNRKD